MKLDLQILRRIHREKPQGFFGAPYMHLAQTSFTYVMNNAEEEGGNRHFEAQRLFEQRFAPVSCNRNNFPLRQSQSPSRDRSVTDEYRTFART